MSLLYVGLYWLGSWLVIVILVVGVVANDECVASGLPQFRWAQGL